MPEVGMPVGATQRHSSEWRSPVVASGLTAPDGPRPFFLTIDTESIYFPRPVMMTGEGLAGVSRRQLMRWGAAFPQTPGLSFELSLCANSRIGFCGDAIAGLGFGRVEGALRSAEALADQIQELSPPSSH